MKIALASMDRDERDITEKILAMLRTEHVVPHHDLSAEVEEAVALFDDQKRAVETVLRHQVSILFGAPGTGKTHTVRYILHRFPGANIELAAPTGKAAKRLIELTGRPAMTIHKLLEYGPDDRGNFTPGRDEESPLEASIIIIDECSMIDVHLMANFLRAVPTGTKLILVGDPYQLPSVGPGNVLKDLIQAGVPSVELTVIKRQNPGDIILNCHAIKNGRNIRIDNEASGDFFFVPETEPERIVDTVVDLVARRLPARYGSNPMKDIQVLSARRDRSTTACDVLNKALQVRLNPNQPLEKCKFAVGDKVIHTVNSGDLVNGDIFKRRLFIAATTS